MRGHDLNGGDRLDRLAQAHFVADQASPGFGREEDAFSLIIVQVGLQQFVKGGRAADAVP